MTPTWCAWRRSTRSTRSAARTSRSTTPTCATAGRQSVGEPGLGSLEDGESGDVYLTLVEQDGVWVGDEWSRTRPDDGPYLACDDRSWQVRCGIESWFLPQDDAQEAEHLLRDGAVAELRVDDRGNAAVVDVRAR